MLRRKLSLKRRSNNELPEAGPRIIIDNDDTANHAFNASSQSPAFTEEYFDSPISPKISAQNSTKPPSASASAYRLGMSPSPTRNENAKLNTFKLKPRAVKEGNLTPVESDSSKNS